jgi:signal transduction histidine kinase
MSTNSTSTLYSSQDTPSYTEPSQATPPFSWHPLKLLRWWITPRTTQRQGAFYERNVRGLTLLMFVAIVFTSAVFIPAGTMAGYEGFLLGLAFAVGITSLAVMRGYTDIASYFLTLLILVALSTSILTSGYWAPNAVSLLLVIPVLIALLLRSDWAKLVFILLTALMYILMAFYQQNTGFVSIFDSSYSFSTPTGASLWLMVMLLLLVGGGSYFLWEFRSQRRELVDLIATLDARVEARTSELREALDDADKARQEAELAREEAEVANQTKSQFLANMSHELRTPLNAILNFTAFVADGVMGPVNDEQVETLQQSISSGKHLLSLINDILDITKIEAGLMDLFIEEVDINETLMSVVSVAKGLVKDKPQVTLMTEIQANMVHTWGDKRRLRQVFLNIVSNAVKFTPEGHIKISAHVVQNMQGKHIHIAIEDTGIGIAPEDHDLVFESFKQAKHDFQKETVGTGLGMPISRYFVLSHGGKIRLESALGEGTSFFVELPVLTEEQAHTVSTEMADIG